MTLFLQFFVVTKYNNSMVETNVRIIEELKYFLEAESKDPSLQKLVTETEKDFTRKRKLPLERIVEFIISYQIESFIFTIMTFDAASFLTLNSLWKTTLLSILLQTNYFQFSVAVPCFQSGFSITGT